MPYTFVSPSLSHTLLFFIFPIWLVTFWHIFVVHLLALLLSCILIFDLLPFWIVYFSLPARSAKTNHTHYCCVCDLTHISFLPSNACTNMHSTHRSAFLLLSFFFFSSVTCSARPFSPSFCVLPLSLRPPFPWLSTAFISQLDCPLTENFPLLHFSSCSSITAITHPTGVPCTHCLYFFCSQHKIARVTETMTGE